MSLYDDDADDDDDYDDDDDDYNDNHDDDVVVVVSISTQILCFFPIFHKIIISIGQRTHI